MQTFSVRLSDVAHTQLRDIARVDGVSMNSLTLVALDALIAQRRGDPDFKRRLGAFLEQERAVLERLA